MQEYEEKLRKIGLTEYETKVYLTLLKHGQLTGGQVSKLSGVPHGRTYEVLLKLVDKGLISVLPISPKLFKVLEPKYAFQYYLDKQITELGNLGKEIPLELGKIKTLAPRKETTTEKINVIWGKKNIRPIINKKYAEAKEYIKVMFTYEYVSSSSIQLIEKALKKGVRIYRLATKLTDKNMELMKADVQRGCEVRYYPVEEIRIEITDGIKANLHVVNPKDLMDRTFIEIESLELTKALEHYFDTIWKKAKIIKV